MYGFHKVVDGDDAHKAGEHAEYQRGVHQEAPAGKPKPGIDVGHHQREYGGKEAAESCHQQGIAVPAGKIEELPVGEEAQIVVQGKAFWPEIGGIGAGLCPEGGEYQPKDRHQPQNGEKSVG